MTPSASVAARSVSSVRRSRQRFRHTRTVHPRLHPLDTGTVIRSTRTRLADPSRDPCTGDDDRAADLLREPRARRSSPGAGVRCPPRHPAARGTPALLAWQTIQGAPCRAATQRAGHPAARKLTPRHSRDRHGGGPGRWPDDGRAASGGDPQGSRGQSWLRRRRAAGRIPGSRVARRRSRPAAGTRARTGADHTERRSAGKSRLTTPHPVPPPRPSWLLRWRSRCSRLLCPPGGPRVPSTVRALADAARTPRRGKALIALSAHLPAPLLVGLRIAARRPRRTILGVCTIAIAICGMVVVMCAQTKLDDEGPGQLSS